MTEYQQWDIVSGIGITALAVSAMRALESARPDGLVNDPFAEHFVRAAQLDTPLPVVVTGESTEIEQHFARMSSFIGVRSRFFDDYFATAQALGVQQIVILAAGLDTRAFRLDWSPGTRLFEIDQPKVLEYKETVLSGLAAEPRCERHAVAADLRDDWPAALEAAGFDRTVPTAWLAEGLFLYLPPQVEEQILRTVHALSVQKSHLGVEASQNIGKFFDQSPAGQSNKRLGIDVGGLMNREDRIPPDKWLSAHGWTIRTANLDQVEVAYRRDLTGDDAVVRELRNITWLVTATLDS